MNYRYHCRYDSMQFLLQCNSISYRLFLTLRIGIKNGQMAQVERRSMSYLSCSYPHIPICVSYHPVCDRPWYHIENIKEQEPPTRINDPTMMLYCAILDYSTKQIDPKGTWNCPKSDWQWGGSWKKIGEIWYHLTTALYHTPPQLNNSKAS